MPTINDYRNFIAESDAGIAFMDKAEEAVKEIVREQPEALADNLSFEAAISALLGQEFKLKDYNIESIAEFARKHSDHEMDVAQAFKSFDVLWGKVEADLRRRAEELCLSPFFVEFWLEKRFHTVGDEKTVAEIKANVNSTDDVATMLGLLYKMKILETFQYLLDEAESVQYAIETIVIDHDEEEESILDELSSLSGELSSHFDSISEGLDNVTELIKQDMSL